MSRSYRKHPWIKCAGDPSCKKAFNRKLRRSRNFRDIPNGNAYRKLNCSWEIADFRSYCSWKEFQGWYQSEEMNEEEMRAEWKRKYWSK